MSHPSLAHLVRQLNCPTETDPNHDPDDRRLLDRFSTSGDEEAFACLVRRHAALVLGVGWRVLRQAQDVEDVFQATFLVLARKAASLRWRSSVAGWLHEVAHRLALKTRAAAARRAAQERQLIHQAASASATDLGWREFCGVLDEELPRLPEKFRTPLVLCYLEGQTRDQAAQQLGWSLRTVERRLEQGRQRLRLRLARRGLVLPGALCAAWLTQGTSAAVPAALIQGTVRTAGQFLAGGSVAPAVAVLTQGALRTMLFTKVKLAAAVVVMLGLLAAGAGLLAHQAAQTPDPRISARSGAEPGKPVERTPGVGPQAAVDQLGDPLPPGALARMGTLRFRQTGFVYGVALAPDGKTVAAGSYDAMSHQTLVCLWDVATGKELRRFQGAADIVTAVAFSPDGKVLAASGYDNLVHLWDVATGKKLLQLKGHEGPVHSVVFSSQGDRVATAGDDATIRLWQPSNGQQLGKLTGHVKAVMSLAFAADGKTLLSGGMDGTVRLWEPASGKELRQLTGHQGVVFKVALSADGKLAVSGGVDKTLRLWDATTGKQLHQLTHEGGSVVALALSPDGRTVASGRDGGESPIFLWDVASGKEVGRLPGHTNTIFALQWSVDGKTLVSSNGDGTIGVWDVAARKAVHSFAGHSCGLCSVVFSPDGKVLATAGSTDNTIHLWEAAGGKHLLELHGPRLGPCTVDFAPDGKTVVVRGFYDPVVHVWDAGSGKEVGRFEGPKTNVVAVALSPDGKLLATGNFDGVRLWEVASGKQLRFLKESLWSSAQITFLPDGKTLALTGGHQPVTLWDVASGKELRRFDKEATGPLASMVSPDGRLLASASQEGKINLWDVATGQKRFTFPAQPMQIQVLAFSPDGRTLASLAHGDAVIHLWETATGQERRRFEGHRGGTAALAFSADGRRLASGGGDSTALVWDVTGRAGQPVRALTKQELETLLGKLAVEEAGPAYEALWLLVSAPEPTVRLLQERLPATPAVSPEKLARLLADLDADQFDVRDRATTELAALGSAAEPALRKTLENPPSAEVRIRVQSLLDRLAKEKPLLRAIRIVEVLEQIGSPEARKLLGALTKGDAEAPLTREAKNALERLARRSPD